MTNLSQALISGAVLGAIYGLVAVGLSLIFGVMRIVNFAHGAFLTVGMYIAYWLGARLGWSTYYLVGLAVAPLLFLLGVVIQRIVVDPVLEADASAQLLSTFGLGLALEYLTAVLWTYTPRALSATYPRWLLGPVSVTFPGLVAALGSLAAVGALYAFLKYTRSGLAIRAVSQHRMSAGLAGVDVGKVNALTFGIGAALAGVAAVLLLPIYPVHPGVGFIFAVVGFLVVALGGLGNIGGTLVASLVLGVLESLAGTYITVELARAITFGVFIVLLIVKPSGLFGAQERV